jgi:putative N6-adenine-specific DNA methylase
MSDDAPGPVTAPGGLFLVAQPGLEAALAAEAARAGFAGIKAVPGPIWGGTITRTPLPAMAGL